MLYAGRMLFKVLAFLIAAIPVFLFLRTIFFRRPNRVSEATKEFKRQLDIGIYIFIGVVSTLVVIALGKLAYTWWSPL